MIMFFELFYSEKFLSSQKKKNFWVDNTHSKNIIITEIYVRASIYIF